MVDKRLTVVYIAGFNYSGSTLLALLLNAHPLIASTGEVTGPPNFATGKPFTCSCGLPIRNCGFYQELQRRINMRWFDLARGTWETGALTPSNYRSRLWLGSLRNTSAETCRDFLRQRSHARQLFESKRQLNVRFAAEAAHILGTSILVDSSKAPMQLQFYAASAEIELKVIHLVRHPAGCAMSAAKHNGHTLDRAAQLWRRNYAACARQAVRFAPAHTIRVRYEDLCNAPQETLSLICQFLGVDYAGKMLDFRNGDASAGLHLVGNDMRLHTTNKIVLHEEWRKTLSTSQLETIRRITRPESLDAGYD